MLSSSIKLVALVKRNRIMKKGKVRKKKQFMNETYRTRTDMKEIILIANIATHELK